MTAPVQKEDKICARLYARGELILNSAALFGGGEESFFDMTLVRDPSGVPFIPGTSIAGASCSHLARRLFSWDVFKKGRTAWNGLYLFGYADNNNNQTMSPIRVADALAAENISIAVRDGIKIDSKSGVTVDKSKYDFEVAEAGSSFHLELQCIIRENDTSPDEIEAQFISLLHSFRNGEIRLGAKNNRGLGQCRVADWDFVRLEMRNQNHLLAWLRNNPWAVGSNGLPEDKLPDRRSVFCMKTIFSLNHSLFIREQLVAGDNPDGPDCRHLMSGGEPLASGTSLAGALRARMSLIAATLWQDATTARAALEEIFGPLHKPGEKEAQLWASRLRVDETIIEGGKPYVQERVALDRFTGGALEKAKFNEEVWHSGDSGAVLKMNVYLEEPCDWEIGLLLLTLKDFWRGDAGIGGETSLGRGLFSGKQSKLSLLRNGNIQEWDLFTSSKPESEFFDCSTEAQEVLKEYVAQSITPPDLNNHQGSRRPPLERRTVNNGE